MGRAFPCLGIFFLWQMLAAAQSSLPVIETNALIQFGQLLRSPVVTWNTNQNFCGQQGIICTSNANGQLTVSGISLPSSQLSGILSSSLAELQNLSFIDLSNNNITGTIPPSYGSLQNLTALNLSKNRLFGTIPYTFNQLTNLKTLNLANNYMAGGFPPNFNFAQLNTLLLAGNQFCPLADYSQVNSNDYLSVQNPNGCQVCNNFSCLNGAQCFVNSDQTFRCSCGVNFVGQFCELNVQSYGPQPQSGSNNNNNNTGTSPPSLPGPSWSQGNPGVQPADSPASSLEVIGGLRILLLALASLFFISAL